MADDQESMTLTARYPVLGALKSPEVIVAFVIIGIMMLMIIPISPFFLDFFLTLSISCSLGVLLVAIYAERPLEFSVFPTVLLLVTLYRLGLNIATTRGILLHGHSGESAAGSVIHTFGSIVVGGNYVVGLIVFIILVIINFVVITKGSGRVSEVAARFILDAMPGKQMSIDADLNAGVINEQEARERRRKIELEADFYGAMDGASKFVRGDAIAGIIITAVNIIGGLIIGIFQHKLTLETAAKNYTLLTVGDGLVTQIPALIISTAAGIIVTRTNSESKLSKNMVSQVVGHPKALIITGVVLILLALFGLPKLPFFSLAGIMFLIAYRHNQNEIAAIEKKKKTINQPLAVTEEQKIESLLGMDILELEVGYGLISIVDADQDGDLLERVQSIRKQFAQELGIVVPSIHIRDNLQLDPGKYQVLIKGVPVATGELLAEHLLAMNPGHVDREIMGKPAKEPVFGLDALWIAKNQKDEAQLAGYTVVDLSTVIATHLTETIRRHAHELLGRQEVQYLLDTLAKKYPKVVEDLIPGSLTLSAVLTVLQNLLREVVSIRDLRTIVETMSSVALHTKDTDVITEHVRAAIHRSITKRLVNDQKQLAVLTLARPIEEALQQSIHTADGTVNLAPDPALIQQIVNQISSQMTGFQDAQAQPVVLVSALLRPHFKRLLDRFLPDVFVLSHNEIGTDVKLKSVGTVELAHAS